MKRRNFLVGSAGAASASSLTAAPREYRKLEHVIVYRNERFYCAFPSIVRRPTGELLVAFRRAPDRKLTGAAANSHTDANSYLVLVRSRDNGETWTKEPELIWAHPEGGSQDPCMVQLRDGSIVCTSYAWYMLKEPGTSSGRPHIDYRFLGGYLVRSLNGGHNWQGPVLPPPVPGRNMRDPFGKPIAAYNRGAICQGRDGRLYWAVAYGRERPSPSDIHLMISADGGATWTYSCPIVSDPRVEFNETSMYETPKGDLVAFIRSENFDDHTVMARSRDRGKSFERWQDAGFQGHPHHAIRLPDNRVWLVYGYRHKPYGVRARILDAECTNPGAAAEIVLRDDGGSGDLGYPWATLLPDGRVLSVYYFNQADGTRFIGGTICG